MALMMCSSNEVLIVGATKDDEDGYQWLTYPNGLVIRTISPWTDCVALGVAVFNRVGEVMHPAMYFGNLVGGRTEINDDLIFDTLKKYPGSNMAIFGKDGRHCFYGLEPGKVPVRHLSPNNMLVQLGWNDMFDVGCVDGDITPNIQSLSVTLADKIATGEVVHQKF